MTGVPLLGVLFSNNLPWWTAFVILGTSMIGVSMGLYYSAPFKSSSSSGLEAFEAAAAAAGTSEDKKGDPGGRGRERGTGNGRNSQGEAKEGEVVDGEEEERKKALALAPNPVENAGSRKGGKGRRANMIDSFKLIFT